MLEINTVQLAKVNQADLLDSALLDITVKSGIVTFAPSWSMVLGYKSGTLTPDMMETSYGLEKDVWAHHIPNNGSITLACYCRKGEFCHRHILAKFIYMKKLEEGHECVIIDET